MRAGHYHPTIRQTGALCPLPLGTSGKGFLERLPHTIYSLVNPLSIEFILAPFASFGRRTVGLLAFPPRAKRFPRPNVLGLVMPQDVAVSVFHYHAEKCRAGRIPAVLHFPHLERPAPQHKSHRPFIGPVPCVTFHLNLPHRPAFPWGRFPRVHDESCHLQTQRAQRASLFSLSLAAASAFHAAPRNTITAESSIQTIRPIAAASPPYTRLYCLRRT